MPEIKPQRLMNDLRHLRSIGEYGTGVVRPAFSTKDMEARQWLLDRMGAAGLKASMDGVGNVIGRSPSPGKGILMGSHTDTQPQGGWLDGSLGVLLFHIARKSKYFGQLFKFSRKDAKKVGEKLSDFATLRETPIVN